MFHTPAFAGVFGFCSGALANIRAHAYDLERVFGFRPGALTDIRAHAYDSTACLGFALRAHQHPRARLRLDRVFGFRPCALTDSRAHAYDSTACLILQQSGRRRKSGWLLERRSVYSLGGPARTPPPSKAKALLYP